MEKKPAAGSEVARRPDEACVVEKNDAPSGGSAPLRKKKRWTPEEQKAAMEFITAAIKDVHEYMEMTEDDVEEEYRRAGKLDKYDPDAEWKKRYARVAKKHPPPPGFSLEDFSNLIEGEEEDQEKV